MVEEIYIIRHGLTESNKKKIYAGWSDECLCEEGVVNLFEIGRKLKEFKIERIFSSPIRRTIQTAEVINSFLNKRIEIEENLKEMKMGLWGGLSENEVAERFPNELKIWNSRPSKLKIDDRETLEELQIRALNGIRRISEDLDRSRILAVTHVAIIRVLMIYYNNWSLDDYRKIDVPNGACYLLDNRSQKKKFLRVL
jgi:alpha-ribazole phosphatase/probable phosphoglycerate mutase